MVNPKRWHKRKRSSNRDRPFPLDVTDADALDDRLRDSVTGHTSSEQKPTIVSISDIHAYIDRGRSALLTLSDHPDFDPVVTEDEDGVLHWADNNYILLFNGDLVDRGPDNIETLELAHRLIEEAPPGRVRVLLGNHEMAILTQTEFHWGDIYSMKVSDEGRQKLLDAIQKGYIGAAYEGYSHTYAHAGQNDQYSVADVNKSLVEASAELSAVVGTEDDSTVQSQLPEEYPRIFGLGPPHGRGKGAGLLWLDFNHLSPDASPQIVGHSRHDTVTRDGRVICQNVIRNALDDPGGEAVVIETPTSCETLRRGSDGDVYAQSFSE